MTQQPVAAIRFGIRGAMRFLSHAETARVLQRACARAGVAVRYSEGFNPHPRMSLPLPRPVGVEADDELLVVRLRDDGAEALGAGRAERETALKDALAAQLPAGMEVRRVALVAAPVSFQPRSAEYRLPVRVREEPGREARLQNRIAEVMARDRCPVARAAAPGRAAKSVDVRPFLDSIRLEGDQLVVRHRTGPAGSIRPDEILQLFGLRAEDLAGAVRRTNVTWENEGFMIDDL
jgi:radical SAM-linked protein